MCKDIDLFGEVIILKDDVEFWLDNFTRYGGETTTKRKQQYINNYPVASIIKAAKLNGSFYVAKSQQAAADSNHQQPHDWIYPTVYKDNAEPEPCPDCFHVCNVETCAIFIKRQKRDYSRMMASKRKSARASAL